MCEFQGRHYIRRCSTLLHILLFHLLLQWLPQQPATYRFNLAETGLSYTGSVSFSSLGFSTISEWDTCKNLLNYFEAGGRLGSTRKLLSHRATLLVVNSSIPWVNSSEYILKDALDGLQHNQALVSWWQSADKIFLSQLPSFLIFFFLVI